MSELAQNAPIRPIEAIARGGIVRLNTLAQLSDDADLPPGGGTEGGRPTRREYDCIFIRAGRVRRADGSDSNWLIPPEPLRQAVHLFNGLSCYCDHPEMFGFGWYQSPRTDRLIAVTSNAAWDEDLQGIIGKVTLYDENPNSLGAIIGDLWDQILADQAQDKPVPPPGLSAAIWHKTNLDKETGITATTEITKADSVDFVYEPGAGGYIRSALEAIRPHYHHLPGATQLAAVAAPHSTGGNSMPPEPQQENGTPANGSNAMVQAAPQETPALDRLEQMVANLTGRVDTIAGVLSVAIAPTPEQQPEEPVTLVQLQERLDRIEAATAEALADITIEDMGHAPSTAPQWAMLTSLDQLQLAVENLFSGQRTHDVHSLTGIRDLYHLLSGDYEMTGVFNPERIYLANVTSSTMAQLVANVLNKIVANKYQVYPRWWKNALTERDFSSLQQIRWITLGGIGELPTVEPGSAYTEMTWDDLAQRSDWVKKGGYLGITLEAIDKDDTARIQAAPGALAQAAWLTFGKSVSAIFTVNSGVGPNIYYDDSNTRALFHVSNDNLGSSPFSHAAYKATKIAMMKQTEVNSEERMGALLRPHYLWVPLDLEDDAIEELAAGEGEIGSGDYHVNPEAMSERVRERLARARDRVITCPFWANANNWAAQADPQLWATIGVGYRWGRTPEIFSVASPTAGLMFTNDTLPVKVRFMYAVGPIDWRGLYKHNI